MSWAIFTLSVVMVVSSAYYFFNGRQLLRWVVFWNGIASLWLFLVYIIVIYDRCIYDILIWQDVTEWLIKPVIFILGFSLLLNTIRLGRKHDS